MTKHNIKDSVIACVRILRNDGYITAEEEQKMLGGIECGDVEQFTKISKKIEEIATTKHMPIGA